MITTLHRGAAALFTTAALCHCLPAQAVILSEVRADAGGRWVELQNRGTTSVNLSQWSLHYATFTPGWPQSYWWPFPAGTTLQPGAFLRVNWYQSAPTGNATPGVLWTGTSPYGFLFGLGGEPLQASRGAFGLLNSQNNLLMNTPSVVVDWLSWGDHGTPREWMAIQQGLWSTNRQTPAIPTGSSLARDPELLATAAFQDLQWFLDNSPTPNGPNVTGAVVQAYGTPCALPGNHLLGQPTLTTTALPLLGSASFGYSIGNTTGIYGEFAVIGFSAGAAPSGAPSILPPYVGTPCHEAIDVFQLVVTWLVPTQILATDVPLSLANLPPSAVGVALHAQALVLDLLPNTFPPYQGLTNAVRVVIGQ